MIEEKYNQNQVSYYFGQFLRKLTGIFYTFPEMKFFGQIVLGALALGIVFLIIKSLV